MEVKPCFISFLYSLHATETLNTLQADLHYLNYVTGSCLLPHVSALTFITTSNVHPHAELSGAGPRSVPTASQQKQLCQTQLAASEGETPLSTVILQLFTSCPCLCLSHLINPHRSNGKQPRTFQTEARAALLTQCMCTAPAQCERLTGQPKLHLQKVIALEPSGALL